MSPHSASAPAVGDGHVTSSVGEGIATVSFHHPKGNSLPSVLLRRLAAEIQRRGEDDEARVIVLRSEGTGPFCAGASFDEFRQVSTPEEGRTFFSGFAEVILAMLRAPKFVVTRVQGRVAGGGIGVVAASANAIAARTAAVCLSELAVGIGPFVVGPVIERKLGLAAFQGMAVDTEWHDAEWCRQKGLYTRLTDTPQELDGGIETIALKLAASNPEAMAEMKRAFWAGTEGWPELLRARAEISGRLVLSDFTRHAIEAFAQKA